MASFEFYNDENSVLGGGRRAAGGGKGGQGNRGLGNRAVLGEIGNRRIAGRGGSKQESFPIFCDDDNAQPCKTFGRSVATSRLPGLVDKENQLPVRNFKINHDVKKTTFDAIKIAAPAPTTSIGTSLFSSPLDSSLMDEDVAESPMALDSSIQQWRVPPLSDDGETVDIFTQPEYKQDIYNYLRQTEMKHAPKWNYMTKQPDITNSMRSILVDWLVEVSEEYKLQTETLYLAVSYIDRFLSVMSVQRAKLQLVGTAAMFIASKYEEIYPPDVSEFVYITDDTYNKKQVLRMEHLVLKVLGFDLSVPSSHLFVSQLSEMAGSDERTTSFAMYLNELSLMSGDFLQFSPSKVAATSVALARHTLGVPAWPLSVERLSGFVVADFQPCLLALHQAHQAARDCPQQAIREKYKTTKHHCVSEISPALLTHSL